MDGETQEPVQTRGSRWIVELPATIAILAGNVGVPVLLYNVLDRRIIALSMVPAGLYVNSPLATLHFTRSLLHLQRISGDLAAIGLALLAFLLAAITYRVLEQKGHSPRSLPRRVAIGLAYCWLLALMPMFVCLCIDF